MCPWCCVIKSVKVHDKRVFRRTDASCLSPSLPSLTPKQVQRDLTSSFFNV